MMQANNEAAADNVAAGTGVSPVEKLSDAQVFARDPEDYTEESTADTIARLKKVVARQRKARQDSEAVAEAAVKLKKINVAARKKKAGKVAADPMETTI